jgi:uncharacterized protein YbaR (Trm112 family)
MKKKLLKDLMICPRCKRKLQYKCDAIADINPDTGKVLGTYLLDNSWIECYRCSITSEDEYQTNDKDWKLFEQLREIYKKVI